MKLTNTVLNITAILLTTTLLNQANAAISLDRTRAIFNGDKKTISLNLNNQNKDLPYLAQGWIENEQGEKIESPLIVLPPVQRIEAGEKTQVKVQSLPAIANLPQDRESLFYFNLREIPPRSQKENTLQIALQTRIKLFYRPSALYATRTDLDKPWQENIILSRKGDHYEVNNPTPYYVTIVDVAKNNKAKTAAGFMPVMIAPKSQKVINASANILGNTPVLTYINDYGGRPKLTFNCNSTSCKLISSSDQ